MKITLDGGAPWRPEPGRLANLVFTRRVPGSPATVYARGRYQESVRKRKSMCSAIQQCPTGFSPYSRSIFDVLETWSGQGTVSLAQTPPGSYVLRYWTGTMLLPAVGWALSSREPGEAGLAFMAADASGAPLGEAAMADSEARRWASADAMSLALRPKAAKPLAYVTVPPGGTQIIAGTDSSLPPTGTLEVWICREE